MENTLEKIKNSFKDAFRTILQLETRNKETEKKLRDLQDKYHNDVTSLTKENERLKRELGIKGKMAELESGEKGRPSRRLPSVPLTTGSVGQREPTASSTTKEHVIGAGSSRPDVHDTAIGDRGSRIPRPLS